MILSPGLPPTFIFRVIVFGLLCSDLAASKAASCDLSTYGKPDKDDCLNLFEKFTSTQNLNARFFDEEQLRVDSESTWPGVDNVFEQPIVQLPKYYAMSMSIQYFTLAIPNVNDNITVDTCNFALMPYTDPLTRLSNPLDISSWGSIKSKGNTLIHDCLDQESAGGEISVRSSTYSPSYYDRPEVTSLLMHGACLSLTVHSGRHIHKASPGDFHVG